MELWTTILGYILAPITGFITGVATYIATRRKQKNDFLKELQGSIDLLTSENAKQIQEVLNLRNEILKNSELTMKLRAENLELLNKIKILECQNETLRKEVADLNEKLENVKTITKTKKIEEKQN